MARKTNSAAVKELWISWTRDAMRSYVPDEKVETPEELTDDMVDHTTAYADAMLEELDYRFNNGPKPKPRAKKPSKPKSRRSEEEDDDDDEDDDDEDDDDDDDDDLA